MSAADPTLLQGARHRRATGRLATVIAAFAAATALFAATPTAASAAPEPRDSAVTTARSAASDSGLTASVTAENAGVLAAGQDLTVSVTVSNPTDSPVSTGTVSVWLDPRAMASRGSLTDWLGSADPVSNPVTLGEATLAPLESGTSTVVRVTVPAASIPFGTRPDSAVFGIGATVSAGATATEARGSVVWSAADTGSRSSIGVVMPIVSPSTSDGLISSADLATYTAANGVLTRDLDGLEGHSAVTLGIDPMIIASIRALGNAAPATAVDWLRRLAVLPNETFSLGYGDADPTGQIQAGAAAPLVPTSFAYALDPKNFSPTPTSIGEPVTPPTTTGTSAPTPTPTPTSGPTLPTLEGLTAWDFSLTGIAWPGDKTARAADLAPLAAAGLSTVIVSGDNTNAADLDSTPNAAVTATGSSVVSSDQRLSDALRSAISAPSDVAWNTAMGKLNAQLQLITAEGGDPRHLLIGLDRSWPSSGTQLKRTLDALSSSPWVTPSTLDSVTSAAPSTGLSLTDAPETQTRIDSIRALFADETSLGAFSSVLDAPETLTGHVRAQLLTLLAVSWQNPRTDWTAAVTASQKSTVKILHSIRILPTENINLVSAQGSIPFTVSNELTGEAATVALTAAPSNSRLEIDDTATKRIPQDSRATVLIPVKAKVGNGQVVLSLRLYSPTGVPIGDPTSVTVDVHADWEGIGALILGVLLVLLFGFGIVRNILRRRKERRPQDEEEAAAADGAEPTEPPTPEDGPRG
ncbi:DUF6049 family protein [Leifsonia naganoensis]|uniref:2-oxoglutarate dehydrogenase n=1 Tax=Leifsonia naganoensis TaxID=150025 RepID=A0A853DTR7_9MICO|nr:DUF6049 family protein [Leifsonia naganoensis]NYK09801.1 hypothetical protein [Leifsonia naganoensis]